MRKTRMSRISVDEDVYETLGQLSQGFESANQVLRRLLGLDSVLKASEDSDVPLRSVDLKHSRRKAR
jgi:predicted CopG family antitoxin